MTLLCAWLCAMAFIVVAANPAQAAGDLYFTYVSSNGNDSNTCLVPASACATFQGALAQTAPYGEIDCVPRARPSRSVAPRPAPHIATLLMAFNKTVSRSSNRSQSTAPVVWASP